MGLVRLMRCTRFVALFFLVTAFAASSSATDSRALVGVWRSGGEQLTLCGDGTWTAESARGQERRGSWHVVDAKLIQSDWSRSRESAIVWDIMSVDGAVLKLRFIESDSAPAKRYDSMRTFKRVDAPSEHQRPNDPPNHGPACVYIWRSHNLFLAATLALGRGR